MARDPRSPSADLAAMVHETTNALTVILGWLERADEAHDRPADRAHAIGRAIDHARAVRDDMRRSLGASPPERPPESARALAARTLDDLEREAAQADVQLRALTPAGEGDALVDDPQAVWAILTNLVLNAIAHSPSRATVTLALELGSDAVSFVVRDAGNGVPPERREAIFSGGESHRVGGAGIGLRHALAVARRAGGGLELADSAAGACFVLRWPRAESGSRPGARHSTPQASTSVASGPGADIVMPTHATAATRPARALAGRHVLLLEDDAAVVELLELALGARGATVESVRDAQALEAALASARFDTLLLDLSPLAGNLDPALVERARAFRPGVCVIVISGTAVATPKGVVWVRKPFEPGEVVDAMLAGAPAQL